MCNGEIYRKKFDSRKSVERERRHREETMGKEYLNEKGRDAVRVHRQRASRDSLSCIAFVITIYVRGCQAGNDCIGCIYCVLDIDAPISFSNCNKYSDMRFSRCSLLRFQFHLIDGVFNEQVYMYIHFVIALHFLIFFYTHLKWEKSLFSPSQVLYK